MTTRRIFCKKLGTEANALTYQPYPGQLGEHIYNSISEQAWQEWLLHQTMLINEYRLSLINPKARQFLEKEMINFLFKTGSPKPAGYVPEEE